MDAGKKLDSDYVKSYYDGFLSSYENDYSYHRWQAGPVERIHFAQTKRSLKPYLDTLKGRVLEVGGGDAAWTLEYISHVDKLTFLDISEEMVARAGKRLLPFASKISFINADFVKHDFSDDIFDHVVSVRNLEYFPDKKLFMSRVFSLLRPGGTFVLVTKSPKYHMRDGAKEKALHHGQIAIDDLVRLMESEGLEVIKVYPAIFGKLFRFASMRCISNLMHRVILSLPWNMFLVRLYAHISESFVLYAKKK